MGDKQEFHLKRRSVCTSSWGETVNPTVPPFICTMAAVARSAAVVSATGIIPPFMRNQARRGAAAAPNENSVIMEMFFVRPMWAPVGVSEVQK